MKSKEMRAVIRLAELAMLTAVAVVLVYLVRIPLIPAAPFLEYDFADVPVLFATFFFGLPSGLITLLAVCVIQAFTVSAASGWIGFVMHLVASGAFLIVASIIYQKSKKKALSLVIALVAGSLTMVAVMIPLNLVFTGIFMGAGTQVVAKMLIPAIIPFNLLKAAINSTLTFALFTPLKKALRSSPIIEVKK